MCVFCDVHRKNIKNAINMCAWVKNEKPTKENKNVYVLDVQSENTHFNYLFLFFKPYANQSRQKRQ